MELVQRWSKVMATIHTKSFVMQKSPDAPSSRRYYGSSNGNGDGAGVRAARVPARWRREPEESGPSASERVGTAVSGPWAPRRRDVRFPIRTLGCPGGAGGPCPRAATRPLLGADPTYPRTCRTPRPSPRHVSVRTPLWRFAPLHSNAQLTSRSGNPFPSPKDWNAAYGTRPPTVQRCRSHHQMGKSVNSWHRERERGRNRITLSASL